MVEFLKKHFPIFIGLGLLWISIILMLIIALIGTKGTFIYVLDDPYIHMTISRNIVEYGVWGIKPTEFSSASSSVLYTLLLTGVYFVFGINTYDPFIIGFISVSILLIIFYLLILKLNLSQKNTTLMLIFVIIFVPLPSQVFTGMEHPIQMIFDLLFLYFSLNVLSEQNLENKDSQTDKKTYNRDRILLFILAPLVSSIRYEGLFLIGVVCLLLLLKKKFAFAIFLGIIGVSPIAIFGYYSYLQGASILPSSVLIKSTSNFVSTGFMIFKFLGGNFFAQLGICPHLAIPFVTMIILLRKEFSKKNLLKSRTSIMFLIYILTTSLQVEFAAVGWFFRYEAYLILFVLYIGIYYLRDYIPVFNLSINNRKYKKYMKYVAFFTILVMAGRGGYSFIRTPIASINIYQQQYQMSQFVKTYYNDASIAANDVGALSYYTNANIIDLVGLTDRQIEDARLARNYTTQTIATICTENNVSIAIVYDKWFDNFQLPKLPSSWIKVGEWTLTFNVVAGEPTVSFYALNSSVVTTLRADLEAYSPNLPHGVTYQIY